MLQRIVRLCRVRFLFFCFLHSQSSFCIHKSCIVCDFAFVQFFHADDYEKEGNLDRERVIQRQRQRQSKNEVVISWMWALKLRLKMNVRAIVFLFDDRVKIDIQKTKNSSTLLKMFELLKRNKNEKIHRQTIWWVTKNRGALKNPLNRKKNIANTFLFPSLPLSRLKTVNSKCNCIIYSVQRFWSLLLFLLWLSFFVRCFSVAVCCCFVLFYVWFFAIVNMAMAICGFITMLSQKTPCNGRTQ